MRGKRVLIGISGGIAAYKVPMLVRHLVKAGAEVRVIATPAAFEFVTRATLAVLSGNAVHSEMLESETGEWNHHVEMGNWPDLFVIAPLTANTLAKMANGLCDNLVLATYLSAKCPVLVAPAMDLDMWRHPSVVQNIGRIKEFGNKIVGPESGDLASGLVGKGRMTEPEDIFDAIQHLLHG